MADQLLTAAMEDRMTWKPISSAPKVKAPMYVVIAVWESYTTDPYCVWCEDGKFVRWPHKAPPTHWMPLPEPPKESPDAP